MPFNPRLASPTALLHRADLAAATLASGNHAAAIKMCSEVLSVIDSRWFLENQRRHARVMSAKHAREAEALKAEAAQAEPLLLMAAE